MISKWWYHFCYFHCLKNNKSDIITCDEITFVMFTVWSDGITFVIFTVCKNGIFMNSGLKVLPEGLGCSILSKITARMLACCDRTTDVTYWADVTLLLPAMSGRLSLTAAFSLRRFFEFHLAPFSRYKTAFLLNIMRPKHVEQDQIDAKLLGKKLVFWRECRRVGRSLIIVNKSIKETNKKIFFQCKIKFYFTNKHQNFYFHSWLPPIVNWKYSFWCPFGKIRSYTEKKLKIIYAKHLIQFIETSKMPEKEFGTEKSLL